MTEQEQRQKEEFKKWLPTAGVTSVSSYCDIGGGQTQVEFEKLNTGYSSIFALNTNSAENRLIISKLMGIFGERGLYNLNSHLRKYLYFLVWQEQNQPTLREATKDDFEDFARWLRKENEKHKTSHDGRVFDSHARLMMHISNFCVLGYIESRRDIPAPEEKINKHIHLMSDDEFNQNSSIIRANVFAIWRHGFYESSIDAVWDKYKDFRRATKEEESRDEAVTPPPQKPEATEEDFADFEKWLPNNLQKRKGSTPKTQAETAKDYVRNCIRPISNYITGNEVERLEGEHPLKKISDKHLHEMSYREFRNSLDGLKKAVDELDSLIKGRDAFGESSSHNFQSVFAHYIKFRDWKEGERIEDAKALDGLRQIDDDPTLASTEEKGKAKRRVGHDRFKKKQHDGWGKCCVTGYDFKPFLIASHIIPWSKLENNEEGNKKRLSFYNGLLLTPNLDAAFDKGYISFENDGSIMISEQFENHEALGIEKNMRIDGLQEQHHEYLEYHRTRIYKS